MGNLDCCRDKSQSGCVSMGGVGEHFNGPSDSINATEVFKNVITSKLHTLNHVRS